MNADDYIKQHRDTWAECWGIIDEERESLGRIVEAMVKAAYAAGMREQQSLQYQAEQMEDAQWPEMFR